jgi:DNA-binding GntR family transcriptional regulator
MEPTAGRASGNKRESLGRLAYERIKGDILDERLLPRQPLIEAELAAKYGMSKTPVREALLSLAREGLVEMSSFRGGRVRDFTADDAREIYELRELLEPFALRRAVPRLTDGDRRSLRDLLDKARAAAEGGDRRELSRLNCAFHGSLVARCGNEKVIEILAHLQNQVRVMSLRLWNVRATHLREAEQHEAILTAIEAGQADRAAKLLGEHISEFRERYVREWDI